MPCTARTRPPQEPANSVAVPSPSLARAGHRLLSDVPGFLSGDGNFRNLAEALTARGVLTIVVLMQQWHWILYISGRSMRPNLEWIDCAVRHVTAWAARPLFVIPG